MEAAIYSLHKAYPKRYAIGVDTTADELFINHPLVCPKNAPVLENAKRLEMHYPLVNECNHKPVHFLQGYCDFLAQALQLSIPLATTTPRVYLSDEEKGWMPQVQEITGRKEPYWIVNAGVKTDYTAKAWGTANYQRLVDSLQGVVRFVQIGALEDSHLHPPLTGVLDLRGKTSLRQLVRLVYHASGAVGPTTFLQHLCAALRKPYVCLLGGREPLSWVTYPRQQTLHTLGALECCKTQACWRSRTVPLHDGGDHSLCVQPLYGSEPIPRCMGMIGVDEVRSAVLKFHSGSQA